jgi:HSP20 family protein
MNGLERWMGRRGAPARWEPVGFRALQDEMSRVLEGFLGERALAVPAGASDFVPAMDVTERADAVLVKMEIPGIRREDVEIRLVDDLLAVRGEKKAEREEKGEDHYVLERSFGAFARSLRLPARVKAGEVKAVFRDGVLEITLPKAEEAKAKEVKVAVQ